VTDEHERPCMLTEGLSGRGGPKFIGKWVGARMHQRSGSRLILLDMAAGSILLCRSCAARRSREGPAQGPAHATGCLLLGHAGGSSPRGGHRRGPELFGISTRAVRIHRVRWADLVQTRRGLTALSHKIGAMSR